MTDPSQQTSAVVPAAPQGLVPFDYSRFDGAPTGYEGADAKDLTTPFMAILQTNSKALVEGHAKFAKGAKAGMFMNTGTGELYAGSTGFGLVPLRIDHCVVEWEGEAGNGRFAARHEIDSPVYKSALERFEANPDPKKTLSKDVKHTDGHALVETYYLWALVLGEDGMTPVGGAILPFKSTNISIYRKQVYTRLQSFKGTGGKQPPLYVHRLRCTLASEPRPKGISFNYRFEPLKGSIVDSLIDPASPLMAAVFDTVNLIHKGEIKMASPDAEAAATAEQPGADPVFS